MPTLFFTSMVLRYEPVVYPDERVSWGCSNHVHFPAFPILVPILSHSPQRDQNNNDNNKETRLPTLWLLNYLQSNSQIFEEKAPKATNNPTSTTSASSRSTAAASHQPENDEPSPRPPGVPSGEVSSMSGPAPLRQSHFTDTEEQAQAAQTLSCIRRRGTPPSAVDSFPSD